MKTAASLIQIIALSTCFAVHVASAGEFEMAGVRRAIQTMASPADKLGQPASFTMEAAPLDG